MLDAVLGIGWELLSAGGILLLAILYHIFKVGDSHRKGQKEGEERIIREVEKSDAKKAAEIYKRVTSGRSDDSERMRNRENGRGRRD